MISLELEIRSYITIFSLVFLIAFLSGCQTTDTIPKEVVPMENQAEQNTVETQEKLEKDIPTAFQSNKPVICAPPKVLQEALKKSTDKPFAVWNSLLNEFPVVMLVDDTEKTLTVLEYIGNGHACFISVGKELQVINFPTSTNIKVNYNLWK